MLARATPGRLPLGVSSGNLIYTAFPDRSYQYKATVVSSSGSDGPTWARPGSAKAASRPSACGWTRKGVLYVAYADDAHEEDFGDEVLGRRLGLRLQAGISKGRAGSINLVSRQSGVVYTAFTDAGKAEKP